MVLTIITPCCRQANLPFIYQSIKLDLIDKWYIVYDTSNNRHYQKIYNDPKIIEIECDDIGVVGHPQRNFGMNLVKEGFIYFLDDDNIIHPDFWEVVGELDTNYFYTWDQLRNKQGDDSDWALFSNEKGRVLKGNVLKVQKIDTAQFIVPKHMVEYLRWKVNDYRADGYFIENVDILNPGSHKYIPKVLCFYNYLE